MRMHNYPLPTTIGSFEIEMQEGAKIECALEAKNEFRIYAHEDPHAGKEIRSFIYINGGEETEGYKYIGTYVCNTIPFHLYEIKQPQ